MTGNMRRTTTRAHQPNSLGLKPFRQKIGVSNEDLKRKEKESEGELAERRRERREEQNKKEREMVCECVRHTRPIPFHLDFKG